MAEMANWTVIFRAADQVCQSVDRIDPQSRFRSGNVSEATPEPAAVRFDLRDGRGGREDLATLNEMVDQFGVDRAHLDRWTGPSAPPGDRQTIERAAQDFLDRKQKAEGTAFDGDKVEYATGLVRRAEEAMKLYRDEVKKMRDRGQDQIIARLTQATKAAASPA